jgi:alpha-N-arabinofuranosidase
MRRKHWSRFLVVLHNFLFLVSVLTIFFLCSSYKGRKGNSKPVNESIACFDYFSYKGEDDSHIQNPSHDNDYICNPILSGLHSDSSIYTNGEGDIPYLTQGEDLVPTVLKRNGTESHPTKAFGNFEYIENFDSKALGSEWTTLRAAESELYSLTDKPGYLSLKCAEPDASEGNTPAFMYRRICYPKFECTTMIYFTPEEENEAAGILLYKDEIHQYFLSVSKSATCRKISLNKISPSGSEIIASHEITTFMPLQLKVVSKDSNYDFCYAVGKSQMKKLIKDVDAQFLSSSNSSEFIGTTIGLYATKK